MSLEDREHLRQTHALHQERYLEAKRVLKLLKTHLFNAHNSLEARLECLLPVSSIRFLRQLWSKVDDKRMVILEPPTHKGKGNPITEVKNKEMLGELRSLRAPFVIDNDKAIRKQLLKLVEGYTLHTACLSKDGINGAAWDFVQMCDDVLSQCESDNNLAPLPSAKEGEKPPLRVIQELYDAMRWSARNGLTMMTVRCMHTLFGHNNPRLARNPFMYLGQDKTRELTAIMSIGGDASQHAVKYRALEVKTLSDDEVASLPVEGIPYPEHYRRLAKYRVRIVLNVPRRNKPGCPIERCHLKSGGDLAAAHAGWALFGPVAQLGGRKVCFECMTPAWDWTDAERIAEHAKRFFIVQCISNHVNIIGQLRKLGKLPADTPDATCPHCGRLITDEVEKEWKAKLEACETKEEREQLLKEAAIECGGGIRGSIPVSPMEPEDRTPTALHSLINVVGTSLAVTFMAIAKDQPKEMERRRAGDLLTDILNYFLLTHLLPTFLSSLTFIAFLAGARP